jgi:lincosamide nucleotidyltransferase A/C/D/E
MTGSDVVSLYAALEVRRIQVWIDGGWCVDALLGRQTRPHSDLDIALEATDAPAVIRFLEGEGYRKTVDADNSDWNFVAQGGLGQTIDAHIFVHDLDSNGVLGPPELGYRYPVGSLQGWGKIEGHTVRCIAPEYIVRFKSSYAPRGIDAADVAAICARYGLPNPLD